MHSPESLSIWYSRHTDSTDSSLLVIPLDSTQCSHRTDKYNFFNGRLTLVSPCVGVLGITWVTSFSLLIQRWFVRWEVSSRTTVVLYSVSSKIFFKTVHSYHEFYPSIFFFKPFAQVQVVQLYSSLDTIIAWKKSDIILSEGADFRIVINLSTALPMSMLYRYICRHRFQ